MSTAAQQLRAARHLCRSWRDREINIRRAILFDAIELSNRERIIRGAAQGTGLTYLGYSEARFQLAELNRMQRGAVVTIGTERS